MCVHVILCFWNLTSQTIWSDDYRLTRHQRLNESERICGWNSTGLLLQTDFHPSVSVRLVISLKHSYDNITWSKRKSLFPSCSPLGFYFTGTISCLLLWCRRRGRAAHQPDSDRKIKIHNINWCRVFKNKISPIFHDLFHNLSMVVRERRHLLIKET